MSCLNCSFLALPHPGLAIYRTCIELESNLASNGDKDSLVNARKLYESALKNYDQNLSLWRDYYCMETKVSFPMVLHLFNNAFMKSIQCMHKVGVLPFD